MAKDIVMKSIENKILPSISMCNSLNSTYIHMYKTIHIKAQDYTTVTTWVKTLIFVSI